MKILLPFPSIHLQIFNGSQTPNLLLLNANAIQ